MGEFSWVTLATNDSYSLGALVLAYSLKRVGTRYQLVVMVTPGVTQQMREKLASVFDLVFEVNILDSKDERNLLLLQRPELGITFTKLHCWRLTQFKKCVFLDADTLVLQNCDELFDREEFSAAPDVGWPDCFNSGVFVYAPSDETFNNLLTFALERGSFDGGDQGLLNLYFSDWAHKDISKHLPFIYNMCSTACYSYLPAFKQFGENVKIVHFIGNSKPWLQYFNSETLQVTCTPGFNHLQVIFDHWWNLFCNHVHSRLAPTMARINTYNASLCTSSSLTFTCYQTESICEDFNTEINNISIWDPWENYLPENDNQTTGDNNVLNNNNIELNDSPRNNSVIFFNNNNENNDCIYDVNINAHCSNDSSNLTECITSNPAPNLSNRVPSPQNACEISICQTVTSTPVCDNQATKESQAITITHSENIDSRAKTDGGLAGAFAQMTLREPRSASQGALEEHIRRQGWEAGRIDYLGQDSFDNVWKKICETMSTSTKKEPTPPKDVVPLPVVAQETAAVTATQPLPTVEPTLTAPAPVTTPIVEPSPATPAAAPTPVSPAIESIAEAESTPVVPAAEPIPIAPVAESVPITPAAESTPIASVPEVIPVAPTPEPTSIASAVESPPTVPAAELAPVESTPAAPAVECTPATAPVSQPTPTTPAAVPVIPVAEPSPAAEITQVAPVIESTPTAEPAPAVPLVESTPAVEPTPVASAVEPIPVAPTVEPTPTAEPIPAVPAAAPTPAVPAAEPIPAVPETEPIPTVPVPEPTAAVPTEPMQTAPAPESTPVAEPVPIPGTEPTPTVAAETKPEQKPEAVLTKAVVEASKETKKPSESDKKSTEAAAPTITETPATPQTPDVAKGELKPTQSKASEPTPTPVPPPRKSGKNGSGGGKKSSKKK